jgi:hypothetical protein
LGNEVGVPEGIWVGWGFDHSNLHDTNREWFKDGFSIHRAILSLFWDRSNERKCLCSMIVHACVDVFSGILLFLGRWVF